MIREWIIFALCLGIGGHIALGMILHAPDYWPWRTAGFYGFLSGLAVYALIQSGRGLWKLWKSSSSGHTKPKNSTWTH
jgi:hypothetical protein